MAQAADCVPKPHLGGPVRPLINCADYMGPSSSWSFCRRVLSIIGKQIPEGSVPRDPWHLDGSAFEFRWPTDECTQPASFGCVPSQEYVLLLCSLVRFNLGSFAGLLDHDGFQKELHLFYKDPDGYASAHRLWFTKYLLVVAFGQAFSRRERSGELPGANYAARAMSRLPSLFQLQSNGLLAIEVLGLAAIYLQSVDHRVAAFQHVSRPSTVERFDQTRR